jgi:hypothetical protein
VRTETLALLNMADAIPNYSRDIFLDEIETLVARRKFYTCEELTHRYGVTVQTLKNWEKDEMLIPDLRVGKNCVRYSAACIAAFELKHPGKKAMAHIPQEAK